MQTRQNAAYSFQGQLGMEAQWLPEMPLLFEGHTLGDVTKLRGYQKKGTDFLLYPGGCADDEHWLVEFKFDTYTSGNMALEWVSMDRLNGEPRVTPGWLVTSQASWLCYFFVNTGEMVALRMSLLREWLVSAYARYKTTSVWNRDYFSYCSLIPLNRLLLELPAEAWFWVDARPALAHRQFAAPLLASAATRSKALTPDELVGALTLTENSSAPRPMDTDFTAGLTQHLVAANLKKHVHGARNEQGGLALVPLLPFSWAPAPLLH